MTNSRANSSAPNPSLVTQHRHAAKGTTFVVRDVWQENLEQEFALLRAAVVTHPIVAMDVEFPGVVARPIAGNKDSLYETLRCNVDLLNPIQVGFSLANKDGNLPLVDGQEVGAWQFNFKFSLTEDMFATESIDLLEKAGVNFDYLEVHGVTQAAFGELLIASGLVLDDDVSFVTFHGGYALAYLLKIMTSKDVPNTLDSFNETLRLYLPRFYDIRYAMLKHNTNWRKGSLDALGQEYGVKREATLAPHQAGSDAFMALKVFFAMQNAKVITPSLEGHVYALDPLQHKSAPTSPGTGPSGGSHGHSVSRLPIPSPMATHSDDSHNTPEKPKGAVNYFNRTRNQ